MKKSLFVVVFVLIPLFIHAQGIGLGIKAGANFANQAVRDINVKTVTDYQVGAYLNLNLSENFGIKPEVLYTAYGSKWNDLKVNYDYLAIPVMVRVKPIGILFLEAGPQFSFLTRATREGVNDFFDQLKKNDFSLDFGAGVFLPLGFNIGARYVLGFTNISDVSTENIKNRIFQVYLGWTILGSK